MAIHFLRDRRVAGGVGVVVGGGVDADGYGEFVGVWRRSERMREDGVMVRY